jgi:hypothetical protein
MSDVDKIRFRQSGGFAGVVRGAEIVLADLPEQDRARLDALIRASGLDVPSTSGPSARARAARDMEEIEIEIERGRAVTRHAFSELDLPEPVTPLVEWLKKKARPHRPT